MTMTGVRGTDREVLLLDLNSKQCYEIAELAKTVADKFSADPELKQYVSDIFQTKADEALKLNIKAIAATLEYTVFAPEEVLKKFKELL